MNDKSCPGATPNSGWFRKGQSGNPKGRPTTSRAPQASAFDVVVEKTLTVPQRGGGIREITLEEAIQQRTYQDALAGKRMAQREVLKMIIKREDWLARQAPKAPWPKITRQISPDPDNADAALVLLGVAAPDPTYADLAAGRTRLLLEPWAVQAAINRRRGGDRMTDEERYWVGRCTRDADNLRWPRGTSE